MRTAAERIMERLRLRLNVTKTRCLRAGRAAEGHRELHLAQLPSGHGRGLRRNACQVGEPPQRRPQGRERTETRTGRIPTGAQ